MSNDTVYLRNCVNWHSVAETPAVKSIRMEELETEKAFKLNRMGSNRIVRRFAFRQWQSFHFN